MTSESRLEFEKQALGGVMMHGFDALKVTVTPAPEFFTVNVNKVLFDVLWQRYLERNDSETDEAEVIRALTASGQLEAAGGAAKVLEIRNLCVGSALASHAFEELGAAFQRRQARSKLTEALQAEEQGEPLEAVFEIAASGKMSLGVSTQKREPRIRFCSPSELRAYQQDSSVVLVGEAHVMRGEVFIIGGEPGVGKSMAATELAIAGATGADWLGLKVHRRFRTMILQTENGRYRLKQEYDARGAANLDEWIRVSEPPPYGLTLSNPEFMRAIKAEIDAFKPDLIILDPWNAAAKDDKARDYSETFDALRAMLPTGTDKPALGIVAHTRKPAAGERRTGGTALMHCLSGSYVLTSVPRSIFIMVRATEDETSDLVCWFNPKNSNGEHAHRSAWHRSPAGFTEARDFDWQSFDQAPEKRRTITIDDVAEVFEHGDKKLTLKEAATALANLTGVTENSARNALSEEGKFAAHLERVSGVIKFTP